MVDHMTRVGDRLDRARVLAAWEHLVRTPPWPAAPLWIHGDLHPGNLVFRDGRLSAVIDFGDLAAGDPATDLSVAWMMSASARLAFRDAARNSDSAIDDHTWARARGWALALGVAYLAHSRNDPRLETLGVTTVHAVLTEQQ
jgi:aminoglycoside phosphotransferase (APT) family kinase protein